MELQATPPGAPTSPNGSRPSDGDISVSHATRYLSAAAHLRRAMLADKIYDPDLGAARPPLPVGRSYARRVLSHAQGYVPVSAVNSEQVRKHCRIARRQTVIRDAAAIVVLIISAILEPWGTAVILGLVLAAIVLVGRVRLSTLLTSGVVIGVTLAMLTSNRLGPTWLVIPLICIAVCFVIYVTDILLSAYHVRRIWRESAPRSEPQSPGADSVVVSLSAADHHPPYASSNGRSSGQADLSGRGNDRKLLRVSHMDRVYYDKHGIVGAGTAWQYITLTVPLDKPLAADRKIDSFGTSELLDYIGAHILSLGVGDDGVHGYAYAPVSTATTQGHPQEPGHFTYGLPYLNVATVVAEPLPKTKKHPVRRIETIRLNYSNQPSDEDINRMTGRSPSEHPERYYMRVRTTSWDGQLVTSIYLNAALQGHFLRLIMRPYVLAPIVSDLKFADELAERNPLIITCMAVAVTARQLVFAVKRLHDLSAKPDKAGAAKPGLRSTREHYALDYTENVHQMEDSRRTIEILEQKIIRTTMDYLRKQNIDIGEYEQQVLNYIVQNNTIGTGNIITGGTITNSPVTSVGGQGNTAASASASRA